MDDERSGMTLLDWRTCRVRHCSRSGATTPTAAPASQRPPPQWRADRLCDVLTGALPPPPPPLPPQHTRATPVVAQRRPCDDESGGEHGDYDWRELLRCTGRAKTRNGEREERAAARAAHREFMPGGDGTQNAAENFRLLAAHLEFMPGGDGAQNAAEHFRLVALEQSRAASSSAQGGGAQAPAPGLVGVDAATPTEGELAAEVDSWSASPGTVRRTRPHALFASRTRSSRQRRRRCAPLLLPQRQRRCSSHCRHRHRHGHRYRRGSRRGATWCCRGTAARSCVCGRCGSPAALTGSSRSAGEYSKFSSLRNREIEIETLIFAPISLSYIETD